MLPYSDAEGLSWRTIRQDLLQGGLVREPDGTAGTAPARPKARTEENFMSAVFCCLMMSSAAFLDNRPNRIDRLDREMR